MMRAWAVSFVACAILCAVAGYLGRSPAWFVPMAVLLILGVTTAVAALLTEE